MADSGKHIKVIIEAHDSPERNGAVGEDDKFEFSYAPSNFDESFRVEYSERQSPGDAATELTFNRIPPKDHTFEFILDGTGSTPPATLGKRNARGLGREEDFNVKEQVEKFLTVVYMYRGEQHRPAYLRVIWGNAVGEGLPTRNVLNCVLINADVSYPVIDADGTPLRAKIKAVFRESIDSRLRVGRKREQSPDLSHIRPVEEGDNLPLMSNKVYESPSHYIEVAKANQLKNFRRLRIGRELRFPPLRNRPIE